MHARLLVKLLFVLAVLLFMVLMGMSNTEKVTFTLRQLSFTGQTTAAIMYFIFFGVGVLTGGVLAVGGAKQGAPKGKS